MRLKSYIYSIVFFALCIYSTYAQDTISYDKVLNESLQKNLFIKNELLNISLAKGEYYKTNNFFPSLPGIDLEYETDKFYSNKGNHLFGITLSQEVEIAGQSFLRHDISNYRIRSAELEYKARTYEAVYLVKTLLNKVITAQLKLEIALQVQQINEDLLYNSERRLRAGDISQLDYNLVLIETNNSRLNYNTIETELKNTTNSLNFYFGYEKSREFYVIADTSYIPVNLSLEQLNKSSLENRAEISAKRYERLAATSEISLYKAENIPSLKLSVGYTNGTNVITGDDIYGQHNITKIQDVNKNIKFGLGFNLPLPFNGLFNYNNGNLQVAEIRTKILNNEIELLNNQIKADVSNAYNKWQSAKKNIELLQNNNAVIDNTLELLKKGYDKGEISLINYLTEKQKLFEMRLKYIDASGEYRQSVIELEKATQTKIK